MLDANEARNAIKYFYKEVEGLEIGNPQPYVRSFFSNEGLIQEFNDLCVDTSSGDDVIVGIFYGTVTISYVASAAPYLADFLIKNYLDMDTSNDSKAYNVRNTLSAGQSLQAITQPLLAQYLEAGDDCTIALNGYLFKLSAPTT